MHIFNQELASESNQSSTIPTPHLVILDTGIAIEQSRKNLENLRAVFQATVDNNVAVIYPFAYLYCLFVGLRSR